MTDAPSGLRPMRPIHRHPFVEDILPLAGQPAAPAPPKKASHKPTTWSHAQLMKDLACDGGTGIYAKAKAANGGKYPIIQAGHSVIGTGGSTNEETGVITLEPSLDRATAAQIAIFELTNLSNKAHFIQVNTDAGAGKLGREQYTRANEAIEYQGIANVNKAFHSCGRRWGAPKGTKSLYDVFAKAKNFDDYYKNYLAPMHKNYYRTFWDKNFKAIYDATHPPHKH